MGRKCRSTLSKRGHGLHDPRMAHRSCREAHATTPHGAPPLFLKRSGVSTRTKVCPAARCRGPRGACQVKHETIPNNQAMKRWPGHARRSDRLGSGIGFCQARSCHRWWNSRNHFAGVRSIPEPHSKNSWAVPIMRRTHTSDHMFRSPLHRRLRRSLGRTLRTCFTDWHSIVSSLASLHSFMHGLKPYSESCTDTPDLAAMLPQLLQTQ